MQSLTQISHRDQFRSQIQSQVTMLTVWVLLWSLTEIEIIRSLILITKLHFASSEVRIFVKR